MPVRQPGLREPVPGILPRGHPHSAQQKEMHVGLVRPNSLSATLDAIDEAVFLRKALPKSQREEAATWIASRQGLPGSYAGMFAPTQADMKDGINVFTGEKVRTGAATRHILGEDACRALILLRSPRPDVREALKRATEGMLARLTKDRGRSYGVYCCGVCSVSFWRHLAAGGLDDAAGRLDAGMGELKHHRMGNGQWRRFPFFYTLLALSEMNLPSARAEMRYAAPVCQRYLKQAPVTGRFTERRRALAQRILGKV
jgi:hypothetical protein